MSGIRPGELNRVIVLPGALLQASSPMAALGRKSAGVREAHRRASSEERVRGVVGVIAWAEKALKNCCWSNQSDSRLS